MIKSIVVGLTLGIMVFVTSGYGILTYPKPAEAISWTAAVQLIQQAALAVYKGVVLPLVRQMFLSWAAGESDFPLFPLSITQFVDYVIGTALDAFFYSLLGIHLCNGIQVNIKLAIALLFFYGPFRLEFGFKGCKLTDIIERSKFEFSWDVQVGLFEQAGSDIGYYFLAGDEARASIGKETKGIFADLFASGGALSMQDCSGDLNGNGKSGEKPADCRVTTPGGVMEQFISENVVGSDKAAQQSPYIADALAIGVESLAVYLNTFMFKSLSKLSGSKSTDGALKYDF
ncbi:MAG: hypothetical protein KC925_03380 [Candidatus Doudnabacteria bacterium]|nr:hypothetical protein [Candidatus Doudnabacteria bacterium]MCA9387746.1 hypothetical protein [Candidatus Andersenbacteria bacterium]